MATINGVEFPDVWIAVAMEPQVALITPTNGQGVQYAVRLRAFAVLPDESPESRAASDGIPFQYCRPATEHEVAFFCEAKRQEVEQAQEAVTV